MRLHLRIFMSILRAVCFAIVLVMTSNARADGVPKDCSQLIVAVAPDWNSMRGQMQLFERSNGGLVR